MKLLVHLVVFHSFSTITTFNRGISHASAWFNTLCSLYLFIMTITNPCNYWTLWSDGQRYTFDTYRELSEFSQKLSDERRERIETNVTPWLPK